MLPESQIGRILKAEGLLFLSVDIGGIPTPDEPTVFSVDRLTVLLQEQFAIGHQTDEPLSHSGWRAGSVRMLAHKRPQASRGLDRDTLLQAYIARLAQPE